jgi:hypothetical protein
MLRAVPALAVRAELTLCQTHHLVLRVDRALSPVPEPAAAHGVLQARLPVHITPPSAALAGLASTLQ